MIRNKTIVLRYTAASRTLEVLGAVLIAAVLFLVMSMYKDAPDTVPTGYAFFGAARAWGGRQAALLHPILAVYLYIVATGAGVLARRVARRDVPGGALSVALTTLLCAKNVYLVYALVRTYSVMLAKDMPAWSGALLPVGVGLVVLLGLVAFMRRVVRDRARDVLPPSV